MEAVIFEVKEIQVTCPLCKTRFTIVVSSNIFDFMVYCPKCGSVISKKEVSEQWR